MTQEMVEQEMAEQEAASRSDLLDILLTVIMALSAVATAWSGYQAAAWGGEQASATTRGAVLRAEAERAASTADYQRTVDVLILMEWTAAMAEEHLGDPALSEMRVYEPEPGTRSAFLYDRFREEFRPAFAAWIATGPLADPDAPATPFEMPEYHLAAQVEANDFAEQAAAAGNEASAANNNSSKWVLMGVLFALVLFFASVGQKAHGWRRSFLSGCAVVAFGVTVVVLLSHPMVW